MYSYQKDNMRQFRYFDANGKRSYYSFDGELYAVSFPELWAVSHHPKTGPNNCLDCKNLGMWNGVFIGYCANCAVYVYQGMRGPGMICYGIENDFMDASSIYYSYMKDVSLDEIGDIEMYDTRKIHYPSTKPGDIPTVDDYVQYNVSHVSTPTSDTIIEDIDITDEGEEEGEEGEEEFKYIDDDTDDDGEDITKCCFGFIYSTTP